MKTSSSRSLFSTFRSPFITVCTLLCIVVSSSLQADVKIRPGEKPKETTKDFVKDAKKNGYPTPEPRNRTFAFTEGLSVEITLEVATSSLGGLKFLIRDAPTHGKLSEIRPHPSGESNKAIVTYTHNGDRLALNDSFTFSARLSEGGNSSVPGIITLVGKPAEPQVHVLEVGQFKRLQPGQMDAARVVVMNTGTAPFSAEIKWPAPFVGPTKLDLAINEKTTFMLMITAPAAGSYRLDQDLQPGMLSSRVQALVECIQPFGVVPGAMSLTFDSRAGNRSGSVTVTNGSTAVLVLRLDAPARLNVVKELVLEPKSSKEVIVSLDPKDTALFHGELWVIQEPAREKVVIHAEAEPPQLSVVTPADGKLAFGKVEKGKKGETQIALKNEGGLPALMKVLTLPAPFSLTPSELPPLTPGETTSFTVVFAPQQTGDYKGTLALGGNGGQIDFELSGTMFDPSRPTTIANVDNPKIPRPDKSAGAPKRQAATGAPAIDPPTAPKVPITLSNPPAPAPQTDEPPPQPKAVGGEPALINGKPSLLSVMQKMSPKQRELHSGLLTWGLGAETIPGMKSSVLDPVPTVGLVEVGANHIVLGWQEPKVEPKHYLVQRSHYQIQKDTGLPFKTWEVVKDWKPAKAPKGYVAARIEGLDPAREYQWRVLGVDDQGKFSPSSDLLSVMTRPATRLSVWAWLGIAGALLGITALVIRRVREQRMLAV